MHIGSYDTEPETVAVLDAFLGENGYANDMADGRLLFIRPEKEAPEKKNGYPASDKTNLMIFVINKIINGNYNIPRKLPRR
ncbi:hypothetical protein [Anaerostipes hominis (ex Lee et al. 2021)]|uniref:hypothetical protein n=1 Tax=Anaerostipes hominis (ex Lee et al. 2021) TaxID=2025494 RepID=UPI002FE6F3E7